MPPITHLLAGWCVGNLGRLTPKERVACIAASMLPDLDGLSLLGGIDVYQKYHHVLTHNLAFAIAGAVGLAIIVRSSIRVTLVYLFLFNVHYLMDLYGSGPGWGIAYLWPFEDRIWQTDRAWSFVGWQNYLTFGLLFAWSIGIGIYARRTPLEYIAPRLDMLILRPRKEPNQALLPTPTAVTPPAAQETRQP